MTTDEQTLSRDERRYLDDFVETVSTDDWRPRSIEFRRVLASDDPEPLEAEGFKAVGASHFHEGLGLAVLVARDEREAKRIAATADWFRNGGE